MKYKYFPTPFFTPAITKSKSLHGVLRVNFPHKNGPIPLWLAPHLISTKSSPQPICSSKSCKYDNYDNTKYKVSPYC